MLKNLLKKVLIAISVIGVLFLLCLALLSYTFDMKIGINKAWIERDARAKCNIDSSWKVIDKNDYDMSVLLFYSPDKSEGVTVVYSRMLSSFGYFYKGSEYFSVSENEARVLEVDLENGAVAYGYSSLNNPNTVSKYEEYDMYDAYGTIRNPSFKDGNLKKTVDVNANEPFVYIMSDNANVMVFYDLEGTVIEPYSVLY